MKTWSIIFILAFSFSCKSVSKRSSMSSPNLHTKTQKQKTKVYSKKKQFKKRTHVAKKPKASVKRYSYPVVSRYMKKKQRYMGGVLGQIGTKKVFYASSKIIPDLDKLYWVMVKVLSRQYGCFISAKYTENENVLVKCRDGRMVSFNIKQDRKWLQFDSRQYDKLGREIVVRNRMVVGRSPKRIYVPAEFNSNS